MQRAFFLLGHIRSRWNDNLGREGDERGLDGHQGRDGTVVHMIAIPCFDRTDHTGLFLNARLLLARRCLLARRFRSGRVWRGNGLLRSSGHKCARYQQEYQ